MASSPASGTTPVVQLPGVAQFPAGGIHERGTADASRGAASGTAASIAAPSAVAFALALAVRPCRGVLRCVCIDVLRTGRSENPPIHSCEIGGSGAINFLRV